MLPTPPSSGWGSVLLARVLVRPWREAGDSQGGGPERDRLQELSTSQPVSVAGGSRLQAVGPRQWWMVSRGAVTMVQSPLKTPRLPRAPWNPTLGTSIPISQTKKIDARGSDCSSMHFPARPWESMRDRTGSGFGSGTPWDTLYRGLTSRSLPGSAGAAGSLGRPAVCTGVFVLSVYKRRPASQLAASPGKMFGFCGWELEPSVPQH